MRVETPIPMASDDNVRVVVKLGIVVRVLVVDVVTEDDVVLVTVFVVGMGTA